MVAPAAPVPLQTETGTPGNGTATPGVGPAELVEFAPVVVRGAWFLLTATVVLVVGLFVVEPLIARVVRRRNRGNPTIQDAITRYVRLLVFAVAAVVGAGVAGLANVLTSSALVVAAATLAVGVAAQTVVGSLVGGLVLVFDPEFSVGDYIEWDDGEGTVEAITLRVTRVESPDGALVTVPNTVLTSQAITRPFGRGRCRVVERVDIDYADDPDRATEILESVARGLDGAADRPEPVAFVDELGDGVVRLRTHFWLEDARQPAVFEARSAFAQGVRRRFDEAGITVSPASEHELRGRIAVDDER
ncbi:mechanosensitive ion channel [Halosimplex rubrum]|uniref:Mechanosensitive ion channel n=1 Tax=Halosimplex rubrum TaxID=869889 RepID=A0A7D5P5M2_9EURY|nr:mechanosensitive ion channel domain-containing protein [Halosimplex rubrum]QLH77982.1 mechanosensitive ion channel [Halosimplex rubrum]